MVNNAIKEYLEITGRPAATLTVREYAEFVKLFGEDKTKERGPKRLFSSKSEEDIQFLNRLMLDRLGIDSGEATSEKQRETESQVKEPLPLREENKSTEKKVQTEVKSAPSPASNNNMKSVLDMMKSITG